MITKLFGETEEEQFRYLQPRLIAFAIGIAFSLIGFLLFQVGVSFGEQIAQMGAIVFAIVCLIFGWTIMRGIFGYATVGALLSNNVVVGIVIMMLFLFLGYLGGFFVAIIGLCRFLALLKKRK